MSKKKKPSYFTDITIETIEKLRKGTIKPIEANAIAKQVSFAVQKAKINLDILKFTGEKKSVKLEEMLIK